jgi:hypothetical protein
MATTTKHRKLKPEPKPGPTTIAANKIVGKGRHRHSVPTEEGVVVEMRDDKHDGVSIFKRGDKYMFLDHGTGNVVNVFDRCILVYYPHLGACDYHATDFSTPEGLGFIGLMDDEDDPWFEDGEFVLWRSHEIRKTN